MKHFAHLQLVINAKQHFINFLPVLKLPPLPSFSLLSTIRFLLFHLLASFKQQFAQRLLFNVCGAFL